MGEMLVTAAAVLSGFGGAVSSLNSAASQGVATFPYRRCAVAWHKE